MTIRGHFIGDAPYLVAHLQSRWFEGTNWFLVDTGAARTTILDRDIRHLGVPPEALKPAEIPIIGIGGSVRSFVLRNMEMAFATTEGDLFWLQRDIWVVQHDLDQLPPDEVSRILRLPSVMGRDIINHFRFIYDYDVGEVLLERI
ncbi:hypothetical protein H8E77_12510 [bacterium]|nr:hypothetical protein [bacterium]